MATKPVAWLVIGGGCVVGGAVEEVKGTAEGTGVGATGGSAGGVREDEATDGGFKEVGGAMTTEGAGGEMVEMMAGKVDE